MDGLDMSIVIQTRFFLDGQGGGDWLPWEDHELDESSGLNGDDVPGHGSAVMYEVRIKPAFEPGFYLHEVDNHEIRWWDTQPSNQYWKKVTVYDAESGDAI